MWDLNDDAVVTFQINSEEFDIPKVQDLSKEPLEISEYERSAGGQLRGVVITHRWTWRFETAPLPPDTVDPILDALENVSFGIIGFKTDEMENFVDAKVSIQTMERVKFGEFGSWYKDGYQITFEVEEV